MNIHKDRKIASRSSCKNNNSCICLCSLQLNELVVGDTSGKLLVYKNDDSKPWITRTCVGMVSTVKTPSLLSKCVIISL